MQLAQTAHAAVAYALAYPAEAAATPVIVAVAAADELALRDLAGQYDVPYVAFYEPDLADALTAIAAVGVDRRVLRHLPLAPASPTKGHRP